MRGLLLVAGVLSLNGCVFMPTQDPDQAWVDLNSEQDIRVYATKVDGHEVDDGRYFQMQPGKHELVAQVQFTVHGSNVGTNSLAIERECEVSINYADFTEGQRYRLDAGHLGFRPWAKLYDEQDNLLVRSKEGRCG